MEGVEFLITSNLTTLSGVTSLISGRLGHVAEFHYEVKQAAVSPDLLNALRLPDREDKDAVRALDDEGPIHLLLVNGAQKAIHVRLPMDECGKFRKATPFALGELEFETISTYSVEANGRILK